jgi:hypothetical protein
MKQCRWCKIVKEDDCFGKRSINLDGLYSWCKECTSIKQKNKPEKQKEKQRKKCKEYYKKNKETRSAKAKEYYIKNRTEILEKAKIYKRENKKKVSVKAALKRLSEEDRFDKNKDRHYRWSKDHRKQINLYQKKWYQSNKEKRRANVAVFRAVKSGELVRPSTCSECSKQCKPDGHHLDYSKPLEVVWICRACHSRKSSRTVLIEPFN